MIRGQLHPTASCTAAAELPDATRPGDPMWAQAFDALPDLVCIVDPRHRIVRANQAMADRLGVSPQAAIGQSCFACVHGTDAPPDACPHARTIADHQPHAAELLEPSLGGWVAVSTTPLLDSAGTFIGSVHVARDINQRKRTEEALRRSESLLKEAQRVTRTGHYMLDLETRRWSSSEVLDEIFGIGADYDRSVEGWLTLVHPEDRAMMAEYLAGTLLGQGRRFDKEYRILRACDHEPRWVHGLGRFEGDVLGRSIVMFGTIQDVTERTQAEAERLELERRLLHAQKLESLGVLAGGIAHDFNNLLLAILGHLDLALGDLPADSPAHASIRHSARAALRATDLTRQMLAYSGRGKFVLSRLDLSALVEENIHLFRTTLARKATLTLDLQAALPPVQADAGQIQQIIMNLLTNASDAVGDEPGVILLRTGVEHCSAAYLRQGRLDDRLAPGAYVYLEVTDTGCGMDAATQQRLFDPFFTTKKNGRGLGMSAILGIVRGHKGAIMLDSEPDVGTTIRVLLPAAGDPEVAETAGAKAGDAAADSHAFEGAVLVVDDEEMVRTVCTAILQRLGWDVLTAADGLEAIRVLSERTAEIGAIILDLSMPNMDGFTACRRLVQIKPEVRIVFSSGYDSRDALQHHADNGRAGFVQKPYTLENLQRALLSRV